MSLSDFNIISKLGHGAYSSVYKVERIIDHEIYALKKVNLGNLNEKEKQNSLNEIRLLASIRHKNIIGYREAFLDESSKSLCIVMEFAGGGDLYQMIEKKIRDEEIFSENEVWEYLIQIVRALKCLHDKKILHRDIKSANVFLTDDGVVKLGDLNVSKLSEKSLCQTQTGTPYYASPEVWKDEPYGPKSDLWSLGCVIYEMMALKPPFQAEDMEKLFKKIVKAEFPKLPSKYSPEMIDVVRMLLQKDPYKRPSCDRILAARMITKRIYPHNKEVHYDNPEFLQTIRMPKDMHFLTENLPKPNYFEPKTLPDEDTRVKMKPNKTEKLYRKEFTSEYIPKMRYKKDIFVNNSLILKNAPGSIIEAARNEAISAQRKNYISMNKNIDYAKMREKRSLKEKCDFSVPYINNRDRKSVQIEEKIEFIQRIYQDRVKIKK